MAEPFIGQIIAFAGNFAPSNYVLCQGQLLSIKEYQVLFSILSTTYGGDGVTTFGVPDLRGRLIVGVGQGPGLTYCRQGEQDGAENATVTLVSMASHSHPAMSVPSAATSTSPAGTVPAIANTQPAGTLVDLYAPASAGPPTQMAYTTVGYTGTGNPSPLAIVSPYTCINYIIATQGYFPQHP